MGLFLVEVFMLRRALLPCASGAVVVALCFAGCNDEAIVNSGRILRDGSIIPIDGSRSLIDGAALPGKSVGEPCTASTECRPGLVCNAGGACEFGHEGALDSACVAAGECQVGLQCFLGTCRATSATAGSAGSGCTTDLDCVAGLRCGIVGFAAGCVAEGAADVDQACTTSTDCYAGLICNPSSADAGGGTCQPTPLVGGSSFGIPTAPALSCEAPTTTKVTAHFEIPGAQGSTAGADFFRLPFPNDARIKNGRVDLAGFPTPGSSLLGFDPVQIYVDALGASESGWGTYPTVLFRFSGNIDFGTFVGGTPSPVAFLDITDPLAPQNAGLSWGYSSQGGKYICHDWFEVRHPDGSPLEPGHTYVVYLTTAGRDSQGRVIERSPQLVALLGSSTPADPALTSAYAAYQPFRDYLNGASISPNTILNATVFTTSPVRTPMASLAAAVNAAPVPTASSWVKCGGGAVTPCPQTDGNRACGGASADFDEYHALVSLPIFQQGTAPYLSSGGGIAAAPVRSEDVCMSLTVPKGTPPGAGWPLVVFAHGTGGSFRDHVRPEVSGAFAKATTPMAVLGYDQVQHGPRRGSSTASPNVLFFNFANPAAARGNPLQGAADVVSIGRFATALSVPAQVAGGTAIPIDPAAVVFFGHSQGSMHGSVGLPYSNAYSAAVLSGNGASLMDALLTKTQPVNIAAAVPFLLGADYDGNNRLFGERSHPVLNLLQQWIDPADPLNFARTIARAPEAGITPKSVFQTYGLGDTYSPPTTMAAYALAAGLELAFHDSSIADDVTLADGGVTMTRDSIGGMPEQPVPLSGNFTPATGTFTLAVREYQNANGDGHFVAFEVPGANQDVVRFLTGAATAQTPVVGP